MCKYHPFRLLNSPPYISAILFLDIRYSSISIVSTDQYIYSNNLFSYSRRWRWGGPDDLPIVSILFNADFNYLKNTGNELAGNNLFNFIKFTNWQKFKYFPAHNLLHDFVPKNFGTNGNDSDRPVLPVIFLSPTQFSLYFVAIESFIVGLYKFDFFSGKYQRLSDIRIYNFDYPSVPSPFNFIDMKYLNGILYFNDENGNQHHLVIANR